MEGLHGDGATGENRLESGGILEQEPERLTDEGESDGRCLEERVPGHGSIGTGISKGMGRESQSSSLSVREGRICGRGKTKLGRILHRQCGVQ